MTKFQTSRELYAQFEAASPADAAIISTMASVTMSAESDADRIARIARSLVADLHRLVATLETDGLNAHLNPLGVVQHAQHIDAYIAEFSALQTGLAALAHIREQLTDGEVKA